MGKKVLLALFVVAIAGLIVPAQAACATRTDIHSTTVNGVTIRASETGPVEFTGTVNNAVCPVTPTRSLEIRQGDNVCTGPIADVVTDPFGFGGGPRSEASDACGANYVLATAVSPPVPSAEGTSVDPNGSASIATVKSVMITISSGSFATPWTGTVTIPSGTAATVETRFNVSVA